MLLTNIKMKNKKKIKNKNKNKNENENEKQWLLRIHQSIFIYNFSQSIKWNMCSKTTMQCFCAKGAERTHSFIHSFVRSFVHTL